MKKNKKISLIAIIIVFLGVLTSSLIFQSKNKGIKCIKDDECLPADCCHATSCVQKSLSPDCTNIFCTMACEKKTLDCNQGECKCIKGECKAILK